MGSEPTDRQIIELAKSVGIVTGENLRRDGDYLFRSLGTPINVFGRHLIEFARAVLAFNPPRTFQHCDDCDTHTICTDFPTQRACAPASPVSTSADGAADEAHNGGER